MNSPRSFALIGVLITLGLVSAQPGDIQRGKIVKLDLDANTITLKGGDGKDRELKLTEKTPVLDAKGTNLKEKLQGFKAGADVQFKVEQKDGKDYLFGIKLFTAPQQQPPPKVDLAKLIPLNEMGKKTYQGFPGGFYPDGANERPEAHEAAGLKLAKAVQPLNADGKPDPNGKIVFLSLGMSNTSQASEGFRKRAGQG